MRDWSSDVCSSDLSTSRSFYIDDVDEGKVNAEFKDGVLKVTLPKAAAPVGKKAIEIR